MGRVAGKEARIDGEAARWLAAIESGSADRQAFEQWRSSDPAHALAFVRLVQLDRDLDSLRQSGLNEAPTLSESGLAGPRVDRRRLLMFGAAGTLAAGLGGLGWSVAAAAHEAETALGERHRIVIARGVVIELNTDSRVEWRERDALYDIRLLRGEVMLERQRGGASCRLHCGASRIDLGAGARVDARLGSKSLDVSVIEGQASLTTPASRGSIALPTLRKASIADGAPPAMSALSPLEASTVSAWQQGQLYFDGERLDQAVAEYNRYLSRPLEIADPSLAQLQLGGRFPNTDPTEFCRALSEIYGVSARIEPDRIVLTRS